MEVARDGFARGAYDRKAHPFGYSCDWCGAMPARTYSYVWVPDARSAPVQHIDGRTFCNLGCFRAFHS